MNPVPRPLGLDSTPFVRWVSLLALFLLIGPAAAAPSADLRPWPDCVVVPQGRPFAAVSPLSSRVLSVATTKIRASVTITGGLATTVLAVEVHNQAPAPTQAELLLPLPAKAAVTGISFGGAPSVLAYQLLPPDEALGAYRSLAALHLDSTALEFVGTSALRSNPFSLAAGARQTILVTYKESLERHGERIDYALPRSERLDVQVPWEIDVKIAEPSRIADAYSPTHGMKVEMQGARERTLRVLPGPTGRTGRIEAGPFRLSVLLGEGPMASTIFTANDTGGPGGWFVLLAGLGDVPAQAETPPREVTIVLDRSGSMAGQKFDQAVAAARQVLEGLEFGEAVQIIDYSNTVGQFAAAPVIKTKANLPALRAYLNELGAAGGTNLDGALQAALAAPVIEGFVPVVLFLTDGLPTKGERREHVIRDRAIAGNVHGRRVFTFGVGHDVNASLLDAVAERSRARATYVDPGQSVEVAVADVFEDLSGPVVTHLEFEVAGADGALDTRLVRDLYPGLLPDLFRGDRLLLVGRYTEERPATLRIRGQGLDGPLTHELAHAFAPTSTDSSFVPRLWAMRRIAALEDSLRQQGADPAALAALGDDPRFKETVQEMLRLATVHGVLTDSTAFLAQEGTQLGNADQLLSRAYTTNLLNNSFRSGSSGVSQQKNIVSNRYQGWVNSSNLLNDANGVPVANDGLQTIRGRSYLRRGTRWTEGCLALDEAGAAKPDVEIAVGSPEYATLLDAMTKVGRGAELSLDGEILIRFNGAVTLIKSAPAQASQQASKGVHH